MSEDRKKILEMLADKKISVEEAEKLLAALAGGSQPEDEPVAGGRRDWKYLRVVVEPGPGSETNERVNVRVPFKLIRAGLKFAAIVPQAAQQPVRDALKAKGLDVDLAKITPADLDDILANLDDLTVDVEGSERVRVFCE